MDLEEMTASLKEKEDKQKNLDLDKMFRKDTSNFPVSVRPAGSKVRVRVREVNGEHHVFVMDESTGVTEKRVWTDGKMGPVIDQFFH
jgi:hypothetical protein